MSLKNLTDKQIQDTTKRFIEQDPLRLVSKEFLSIQTKAGELVKLKINRAQQALFDVIKEKRKNKQPIKIWVLKSRQQGISTESESILYSLTSQQPNRKSLILASVETDTDNLFKMTKLYHDLLSKENPYLTHKLKKDNSKNLEFEDLRSIIVTQTAGKRDKAGRSYTFQYIHLSEVAFFPDLKGVLGSLSHTMPKPEETWDTIIIGETTANGMNEFHDEWVKAVEGKTDWIPMFIPWYWMESYSLPLQNNQLYPLDGIEIGQDETLQEFIDEEDEFRIEYELAEEQINWRRWSIVNECHGSIRKFNQENPITWQKAFQLTGDNFFDVKQMAAQRREEPIAYGNVYKINTNYEFREEKNGVIEIYEWPEPDEEYLVTADASEAVGRDNASIFVGNKRNNSTCAVIYGQYPSDILAEICINLGNFYNNCMVVPETKGYGTQLTDLIHAKYGNVYCRKNSNKGGKVDSSDFGFLTSVVTRPQMLEMMAQEIKDGVTELRSKQLISECNSFINHFDRDGKFKKVEAANGKQDGLVICRAIFSYVRNEYPVSNIAKMSTINYRLAAMASNKRNKKMGFVHA